MTTISAIATGVGGSIGIIRLSGKDAQKIGNLITKTTLKPRYVYYGNFYDENNVVDKGIAIFFKAPYSFTGEDVLELHTHGGDINTRNILSLSLKLGALPADNGEFSKRAFLNGKMDLTQAEATYDLINSSSETASKLAIRSLSGEFANQINNLKDKIINLRIFVESSIDFVDEEIEFIQNNQTAEKITTIKEQLEDILQNANKGAILRNGLNVAIIGKPNAGKSSLLNALTGEDTAIITDIEGTTRDTINQSIIIDGVKINIIDTAGIRKSDNIVEIEGIKRAKKQADNADIILLVFSADEKPDLSLIKNNNQQIILVQNKIDKYPAKKIQLDYSIVSISAKKQQNLDSLKQLIIRKNKLDNTQNLFLARDRHINHLKITLEFIKNALEKIHTEEFELLAEELNLAHTELSKITGEFSSDDLLGEIFSKFCIGK